jgi:hypothetical protein
VDDPEGNLVIVERVVHENQRRFPDWEHGWGGTAHILTSTQDGAVEQKEVKYVVPKLFCTSTSIPNVNAAMLIEFRPLA